MSAEEILSSLRALITPLHGAIAANADAVQANDRKLDALASRVDELATKIKAVHAVGRLPWIIVALALLVALVAMGETEMAKDILAMF